MKLEKEYRFFIFGAPLLLGSLSIMYFLFLISTDVFSTYRDNRMIITVESVWRERLWILILLVIQLLIVVLFRKATRLVLLILTSLGILATYVIWWLNTYNIVKNAEDLSYEKIQHVAFLEGGSIYDLFILAYCFILLVLVSKILIGASGRYTDGR